MTLSLLSSLSRTRKLASLSAAAIVSVFSIGTLVSPIAAEARSTQGAFYTATLAAPAKDDQAIIGGVIWRCAGTECLAPKGRSRPVVMCARLAREMGEVTAFAAEGKALETKKMTRCNR